MYRNLFGDVFVNVNTDSRGAGIIRRFKYIESTYLHLFVLCFNIATGKLIKSFMPYISLFTLKYSEVNAPYQTRLRVVGK